MMMFSGCRTFRLSIMLCAISLLAATAQATTYYVAPSGSDANSGTQAAPFATLQRAVNLANPGDTIYMRGGTYALASQITVSRSGSSGSPIRVFNYPNETPVLDGMFLTNQNSSNLQTSSASWWHFKGLESKNAPSHGIHLAGGSHNNVVEECVVHHNVRLRSSGGGSGILVDGTSSGNLILNSDAHHNGNPAVSRSAGDGIGVNFTKGTGNVLRGNRVWRNNDDGIDLWDAANVLVEKNWSWENGYNDALQPSGGNGTGFKLGGGGTGDGRHVVRNNMAWRNANNGFDDNGTNLPLTVVNNTAYENRTNNFGFFASVASELRNNLSFPNTANLNSAVVRSHNSWNLSVSVSAGDFQSLSYSGAAGEREDNGSLPSTNFLKLVSGSDLIGKGMDVGLPFSGTAPDLGAYEYGSTLPAPTGLRVVSTGS